MDVVERLKNPKALLAELMAAHPDARIVTDVGASMVSGWGDLIAVMYHDDTDTIELTFD